MEQGTVDINVTLLAELHKKYGSQIQGYCDAVKAEYDKGNIEAVDALLKIVSGLLMSMSMRQDNITWFNTHIKGGNC